MTYKEKLSESEHRAHYKNIATKILRDMTKYRSEAQNSPSSSRRWIWELIQNAKDVHPPEGVDIIVNLKEGPQGKELVFSHNGTPFSADNIRFLIEQISSKERGKDESGLRVSTGRFGTGFLATHLLSERVTVNAIAKEEGLPYKEFTLELDRSGFRVEEIAYAVEAAKRSVENLDELPALTDYNPTLQNTYFHYPLLDDLSGKVATVGITDLERCLPYALLFVPEVSILLIYHPSKGLYRDKEPRIKPVGPINFMDIVVEQSGKPKRGLTFAKLTKGFTTIALPIRLVENIIEICEIDPNVPKLFCDFPLIGSEGFSFPVVVNNPNFNPTDPRDGVFLNNTGQRPNPLVDENKAIITEAIDLYSALLKHATASKWKNIHLLAIIPSIKAYPSWLSEKWYIDSVLTPIRKKLLLEEIVYTANGGRASLQNDKGEYLVWFPAASTKESRLELWALANDWFPHALPRKEDIEFWYKLIWPDCGRLTFQTLAAFIEGRRTMAELTKSLSGKSPIPWLNKFYDLIKIDEKEASVIFEKRLIVPNQNGSLCQRGRMAADAGNIDIELKSILNGLKKDVKDDLAADGIELEFSKPKIDQAYMVREITAEVGLKTADRHVAKSYRSAFNELLLYFKTDPIKAARLFPGIFQNKHLLYDDEEIMENMEKAELVDEIVKEFKLKGVEDIRKLLESVEAREKQFLPVTQSIIASMGITNVEEWQEALKDKDLGELFRHESMPSTDVFLLAQALIEKAKGRIVAHLSSLDEYDLTDMEATAKTVLAGIVKYGQEINVVFRPAYDGQVIIYYRSERDTLDFTPSELWVDDGNQVRPISLGHLLKSSNIKKFPI